MKRILAIISILSLFAAAPLWAAENDLDLTLPRHWSNSNREMTSDEFSEFARDLASAAAISAFSSYAPRGPGGVDADVSASVVEIKQSRSYWAKATVDHHAPEVFWTGQTRVRVGLPEDLDLAAYYNRAINSSFSTVGGDIGYSPAVGSFFSTAIGFRLGYQHVFGVKGVETHLITFQGGFTREWPNFYLTMGLTEIYVFMVPRNLPRKNSCGELKLAQGLVTMGHFGAGYQVYNDLVIHANIDIGQNYIFSIALKYMLYRE